MLADQSKDLMNPTVCVLGGFNTMSEKERANVSLSGDLKEKASEGGSMSKTIERALQEHFEQAAIHYVNTNAQYVPGDGCAIYENGVVASYGDKDPFGNYLEAISPGDGVVSYVSDGEVSYTGGARAFGIALAPWSGKAVPRGDQVYDRDHAEYHVPVKWLGVLNERNVVSPPEIRQITGRKTPQRTRETPNDEYQKGMRRLAEVIVGRTLLNDLL